MNVPEPLRETNQRDAIVREYDYDDTAIVVADFGPEVGEVSIDIVDETALVVAGDEQFEFELSDDVEEVSTENGVLTIEG